MVTCFIFCKFSFPRIHQESQISTSHVIHDQIQMISILEGTSHVDEEWMSVNGENPFLRQNWIHWLPVHDSSIRKHNYFALSISFIAKYLLVLWCLTFHTLENPPFPIKWQNSKFERDMIVGSDSSLPKVQFPMNINNSEEISEFYNLNDDDLK